eukprot:GHVP01031467.1.p1 GENE.GHVP01031467.1~~GHVP01031467.1.p1  ORF type:complete len:483 (+),score=21.54 GHVP01031467.1:118-1449(+)
MDNPNHRIKGNVKRFVKETLAIAKNRMENSSSLSMNEALAVAMYTFDLSIYSNADDGSDNFYHHFNRVLRTRNDLKELVPYMFYFKNGLNKLPPAKGKFYRGLKNDALEILTQNYKQGQEAMWLAPTSVSRTRTIAQEFAGVDGVVIEIQVVDGREVSGYSCIPNEAEVLLMPDSKFITTQNISDSNGNIIVGMLQCLLSRPITDNCQVRNIWHNLKKPDVTDLGTYIKTETPLLKEKMGDDFSHFVNESVNIADDRFKYSNDHNLSMDEAVAVAMYTLELGAGSFYRHFNSQLHSRKPDEELKPYMYYFKSALNKLPRVKQICYRGLKKHALKTLEAKTENGEPKNYKVGHPVMWSTVTSVTRHRSLAQRFAGGDGGGVVMEIEVVDGRELSSYSCSPNDDEILLKPDSKFKTKENGYINSTKDEKGNYIVKLCQCAESERE